MGLTIAGMFVALVIGLFYGMYFERKFPTIRENRK